MRSTYGIRGPLPLTPKKLNAPGENGVQTWQNTVYTPGDGDIPSLSIDNKKLFFFLFLQHYVQEEHKS